MIRSLALAAITSLALCSLAEEPAGSRPGTPTPNWSEPAETGVAWDSGAYEYDDSGNIVRIGKDAFGYDGVNRLTAGAVYVHGGSTLQTFNYDRYGNLLEISTTLQAGDFPSAPETATLTVNSATNRLSSACNPAGCEIWTYNDSTGELTRNRRTGGTTLYDVQIAWDPSGAMTELTGEVAHERYVYDANDERVLMVSLDDDREVIRRWTWRDATNKVAREVVEHVGYNTWIDARDYVYRNGTLLASFTSPGATIAERHYHVDHLGTPRLITDSARHKLAIDAYLPFGARAAGGEFPYVGYTERMRFTGHERDAEGSPYRPTLDYMHARYYATNWGRFLSVDPAGLDSKLPQTWNRYAYVLNNPVRSVDPTGKCGESAAFVGPRTPCKTQLTTEEQAKADVLLQKAWKATSYTVTAAIPVSAIVTAKVKMSIPLTTKTMHPEGKIDAVAQTPVGEYGVAIKFDRNAMTMADVLKGGAPVFQPSLELEKGFRNTAESAGLAAAKKTFGSSIILIPGFEEPGNAWEDYSQYMQQHLPPPAPNESPCVSRSIC